MTILLMEQNALFALDVSDRAYVIDKGSIVYDGSVTQVKQERELMRECLGGCKIGRSRASTGGTHG